MQKYLWPLRTLGSQHHFINRRVLPAGRLTSRVCVIPRSAVSHPTPYIVSGVNCLLQKHHVTLSLQLSQRLIAGNTVTILVHQLLDVATLADNDLVAALATRFRRTTPTELGIVAGPGDGGNSNRCDDADDRNNDHQLDDGKPFLHDDPLSR